MNFQHPISNVNFFAQLVPTRARAKPASTASTLDPARQELLSFLVATSHKMLTPDEQEHLAKAIGRLPAEALTVAKECPPGLYLFDGRKFCVSGYNVSDIDNITLVGNTALGAHFDDVGVNELRKIEQLLN